MNHRYKIRAFFQTENKDTIILSSWQLVITQLRTYFFCCYISIRHIITVEARFSWKSLVWNKTIPLFVFVVIITRCHYSSLFITMIQLLMGTNGRNESFREILFFFFLDPLICTTTTKKKKIFSITLKIFILIRKEKKNRKVKTEKNHTNFIITQNTLHCDKKKKNFVLILLSIYSNNSPNSTIRTLIFTQYVTRFYFISFHLLHSSYFEPRYFELRALTHRIKLLFLRQSIFFKVCEIPSHITSHEYLQFCIFLFLKITVK